MGEAYITRKHGGGIPIKQGEIYVPGITNDEYIEYGWAYAYHRTICCPDLVGRRTFYLRSDLDLLRSAMGDDLGHSHLYEMIYINGVLYGSSLRRGSNIMYIDPITPDSGDLLFDPSTGEIKSPYIDADGDGGTPDVEGVQISGGSRSLKYYYYIFR